MRFSKCYISWSAIQQTPTQSLFLKHLGTESKLLLHSTSVEYIWGQKNAPCQFKSFVLLLKNEVPLMDSILKVRKIPVMEKFFFQIFQIFSSGGLSFFELQAIIFIFLLSPLKKALDFWPLLTLSNSFLTELCRRPLWQWLQSSNRTYLSNRYDINGLKSNRQA